MEFLQFMVQNDTIFGMAINPKFILHLRLLTSKTELIHLWSKWPETFAGKITGM